MGTVKNAAIKNLAKQIIATHGEKFKLDIEQNKKILEQIQPIKSKKIRNILAGYITKEIKRIRKSGI
jgi:small subunit ribosomal protein S17e